MLTLTALVLLTAQPSLPPLVEAPQSGVRVSTAPRAASLLDAEPSSAGALVARAVMAPVLGVVGGGLGGLGGAVAGGLVALALGGLSWGALVAIVIGGAIGGALGIAAGIAQGAALFSDDVRGLFARNLPWAFLATGLGVLACALLLVMPVIGLAVAVGVAVAAAAAVPLVVEARRLAVAAEAADRAALTVATF